MRKSLISLGWLALTAGTLFAQSLGNSGTVEGTVADPSGGVIAGAVVTAGNSLSGYSRSATTDTEGAFRLTNIPFNTYHVQATAPGFEIFQQDVTIRTPVTTSLKIVLKVASAVSSSVTVEGSSDHMLENVPYAHNDVDQTLTSKLPTTSPGSGLSDAITMGSPGVVADSNGFFHPLGDHAQTTFSIDGQPISDQQSKTFSTQMPLNAIQSMELITGAPNAEFGDKTSLVVSATTRSGLGQPMHGSLVGQYGSFGTYGEEASLGLGKAKIGNFFVVNSLRSGRFLDTPEFRPFHAVGTNGTFFDRFDFQPSGKDAFHFNFMAARNWFQTPNTYDQIVTGQDQRQKVTTFNVAPGYQHTFNAHTLLTLNPFVRHDDLNYYPSRDPFSDSPVTIGENRTLTNWGMRADVAYAKGAQNLKIGTQLMQTRLNEGFRLGVTDPGFNAICVNAGGDPQDLPAVTDPNKCAGLGFSANPGLQPGLVPYDLTRGGNPLSFQGSKNINQYAFYVQDSITLGNWNLNLGLRVDQYKGLVSEHGVQPRAGAAYNVKRTGTVLRASYSRTFETPYNENLILSSATGSGGLAENVFGAFGSSPLRPGRRNQYNAGLQQAISKYLLIDGDYFWKFTNNAFDFGTLLNTPITFPISWRQSRIDGVAIRLSTPDLHGFQAYTTMGHTRARYFGPSDGGLIFNSPLNTGVFRIDHDQAFQQTTNLRYQIRKDGPWASFTWRYDSGVVAGAVGSLDDALALTSAGQAAIGFFCGGQFASVGHPITGCSGVYGATRLQIPAAGTNNPDSNPPRIAPRNIFDIALGTDNLLKREHYKTVLKFTVTNLTNKETLYNFLSTFSGTHFVTPRSYQAEIGFNF